jgi:hypothetical protein
VPLRPLQRQGHRRHQVPPVRPLLLTGMLHLLPAPQQMRMHGLPMLHRNPHLKARRFQPERRVDQRLRVPPLVDLVEALLRCRIGRTGHRKPHQLPRHHA